jgi:predicted nucleic acid-binding protein
VDRSSPSCAEACALPLSGTGSFRCWQAVISCPNPQLWEEAGDLGYALSRRGITVKTIDLLIATYALSHAVALVTTDSDFVQMKHAGAQLLLVEV